MNNNSFDINVRILDFHNRKIEINYVSSLCSDELIAYLVEGITNAKGKTLKDCLNNGDVKEETDTTKYEYAMLTGCAIVFLAIVLAQLPCCLLYTSDAADEL